MGKVRSQYVCQECGRTSARPMGRCPQCGSWDSMVEELIETNVDAKVLSSPIGGTDSRPKLLDEIEGDVEARLHLPIGEFERVLGGGIVPGSIVLVGGDPGIGKSTLLLQMAMVIAQQERVLYVSGEESERQIKMRALRLLHPEKKTGNRHAKDALFTY